MMQQCGDNISAAYRLSHWQCIDTFVYFSHFLVTIPPAGWINAAHLHGVKVSIWPSTACSHFRSDAGSRRYLHAIDQCLHALEHKRRRQVLGTFITEWDAGRDACRQLFASEAAAEQCARQLAAIAAWHGFEGWLINIENELSPENVPHVLTFLRYAAACT